MEHVYQRSGLISDGCFWPLFNLRLVFVFSPGSYMMVDTSQHDYGEKSRLQLPVMKENDTHCIDFNYLLYCPDGSGPGTLNVLVKVNKGPLANPIWNISSCTGKDWKKAELAVSTFWPNEYQVCVTCAPNQMLCVSEDCQVSSHQPKIIFWI